MNNGLRLIQKFVTNMVAHFQHLRVVPQTVESPLSVTAQPLPEVVPTQIVTPGVENISVPNTGFLSCPIQGNDGEGRRLTSRTMKVSAVVDHSGTAMEPGSGKRWGKNAKDQKVVAFNGEVGDGSPSSGTPFGYMKKVPGPFFTNGEINYVGASMDGAKANLYLNYDGHGGTDFPYPSMTPILAPSDGQLQKMVNTADPTYGQGWDIHHTFSIKHANGYTTLYRHCVNLAYEIEKMIGSDMSRTCSVKEGQTVGYVGDFGFPGSVHLHFEVYDPQGKMADPYGSKLWK